jgi:hypothetical protein
MTFLPLALFLTARLLVTDDIHQIPRGDWKYLEIQTVRPNTTVHAEFRTGHGNPPVRLLLIPFASLERFRTGREPDVLAESPYGENGRLHALAESPGIYAVVIENRKSDHSDAMVQVKLELESDRTPWTLPPARRAAWVLVSGLFLVCVSGFAWMRLRSNGS